MFIDSANSYNIPCVTPAYKYGEQLALHVLSLQPTPNETAGTAFWTLSLLQPSSINNGLYMIFKVINLSYNLYVPKNKPIEGHASRFDQIASRID